MGSKVCTKCKETKPVEHFRLGNGGNHFVTKSKTHSYCKACRAEDAREWRKKHTNYQGTGLLKKVPKEDRLLMSMIRARLREAIGRAKKFSQPDVTVDDDYLYAIYTKQQGLCALLGCEMVLERQHPLCASLDKISPALGYVKGNVQWVTWVANRAKGDMQLDDFYRMCKIAVEYQKVQRLSKDAA